MRLSALALPPVARPMVGATRAQAAGVTLFDAADAAPVPTALVAVTVKGVRGAVGEARHVDRSARRACTCPVMAPGDDRCRCSP
jgi:hypothetical protein